MSIRKRNAILLISSLVVLIAVFFITVLPKLNQRADLAAIDTFVKCADARYPIMESYPRQCRTPDGRNFTEQIATSTQVLSDLIVVDSPKPGDTVYSPITVTGKARGTWYFEASFPIELRVGESVIRQMPVQAKSEWMTTEFVPFEVKLEFDYTFGSDTMPATLVLRKDNPSGLPQYDRSVSIPIILSYKPTSAKSACKPTGCSGEICSDQDVVSTCIYRSEYACYKSATCERQASGKCGWTETQKLTACLEEASK